MDNVRHVFWIALIALAIAIVALIFALHPASIRHVTSLVEEFVHPDRQSSWSVFLHNGVQHFQNIRCPSWSVC